MLKFNKIILNNFGSYHHAEVDLNDRGFCLVTGQNNCTTDNALSNGSGKSLLWNAICFTLTGETLSGIHSNLKNINATENKSSTVLYFTADADEYEITRDIAPKTNLVIIKNGVDVSGKTFRETEKKLEEFLPDLNRNLIGSCLILGQGMPNRFSAFSPSDRKALLEKLTKCDFMIEDLKARVTSRQTELNVQIREYEDNLLINKTQLNSTSAELARVDNELNHIEEPDFDAKKELLTRSIEATTKTIEASQTTYDSVSEQITSLDKTTASADAEKAVKEKQLMENYFNAKQVVETELLRAQTSVKSITAEIKKINSIQEFCPTCRQPLIGVKKPSTKDLEIQLAKENKIVEDQTTILAAQKAKYNEYTAQIKADYETKVLDVKKQLMELRASNTKLKSDIQLLATKKQQEEQQLARVQFEKETFAKHVAKLKADKLAHEKTVADLTNLINLAQIGKDKLAEHLAAVKKMDTLLKRDFRGYLLANIISYLDTKAKEYSQIVFGTSELNIYIDGNALDISYCGKMFDNLSGGEKQRVDLIIQFAIRSMLTAYLGFSSNMLVLDEITDFLDKKSCKAVMTLIEHELHTVESVFIVSHHAEELGLPIDSELKIIKSADGISSIAN